MPAVSADTLSLTRLSSPGIDATERPVRSVTRGPRGYEGEGFPVVRAFAGVSAADLDPFIHMDQMGEVDYEPGEPRGTSWHPHRGFETVTYIIDGRFAHQDSAGGGGLIEDGATQWMTAGSGILHIETPPAELVESGGLFHGIQLWVNLPAKDKFLAPNYQNLEGGQVGLVTSPDAGSLIRIIAGEIEGHRGPGSTHTPITLAHAPCNPVRRCRSRGSRSSTHWSTCCPAADGSGAEGRPVEQGSLAVLGKGDRITVAADGSQDGNRPALEVLLLGGGRPIREPVAQYGPFVMNTRQQLVEAVEDYQAGRLGVVPPDALMPHTVR